MKHKNEIRSAKNVMRGLLLVMFMLVEPFSKPTMDIEIDPADFILGGYRVHTGYIRQPMRYDVGVVSVEIPEVFHKNSKFDYEIFGIAGRIDYLFDSYQKSFVGIEGTQMITKYEHKETKTTETRYPFLFCPRIGYRFEYFNHITVTPWLGIGVLLNKGSDQVVVGADKFYVSTLNIFPTLHLGWAF